MPELPEVETLRIGLSKKIIGQRIKKIEMLNSKSFFGDTKQADGRIIKNIWRRAKVLGIEIGEETLIVHLKMSGQLILQSNEDKAQSSVIGGHPTKDMRGEMPNKSTRITFHLTDFNLYFNDQRKFGWVKLVSEEQLKTNSLLSSLGPEPLEKEFSWEILKDRLQKRKKTPIKVAIMDQQIISGVGNIYACEACFIAKIDPIKKVGELTEEEFKSLHKGIVQSLSAGIKHGGSSKTHFVNADGDKGLFLDFANVYNRANKSCKVCNTKIKKIKLGGRGTFYCPNCQI